MKTFVTFIPEKYFSDMKKLLLLLFLTISLQFIICNCFAQEKQPKLNISLGVSPPIKVDGMGKFFNEDWIIGDDGIERKYNRINYFFNSDYFLDENVFLRLSCGLTTRYIYEHTEFDTTVIDYQSGMNNEYRLQSHSNFFYIQKNWNITVGIGYKMKSMKISPYFGADIIFIEYGKGKENGDNYTSQNNLTLGQESIWANSYTMVINGGIGTGIGVFAGIDYKFMKKLLVSLEISEYYLYTNFDGKTVSNVSSYVQDIPGDYIQTESTTYVKAKLQQFAFSNFLPKISIKYSFNK